jgi:AcrR family transcriptional regulator
VVRPREFDESEALEQALAAFWRRGYAACSIVDLVEATGLPRQSLYNTFGDKGALFLRALQLYRQRIEESLAPLQPDDANLQTIRTYMRGVLKAQRQGHFGACLLVKTAFSQDMGDLRIRRAVVAGAAHVRGAFARVIRASQVRGDLDGGIDPASYAAYLYAVLNGLSALATTGSSAEDIEAALAAAFAR